MPRSTVYYPNGDVIEKVHPESMGYDETKKFVQGWVERVPPIYIRENVEVYVNEDGMPLGLRRNNNETMTRRFGGNLPPLFGPVVVAEDWNMQ